jgi:hypothetical protein
MKFKPRYLILFVLFVLYFGFRLYFSSQTPYFNDDKSYFSLRQIENIAETGKPISNDNLFQSDREFAILPLYYYIMTPAVLFSNEIIAIKIINNFLASLLILGVYLITSQILKNRKISLICSVLAAFSPAYINQTLNRLNEFSILIPACLFLFYFYLRLENNPKTINYIIPLTVFLLLSSAASIIVILGIVFYFILNYIEDKKLSRYEIEYSYFIILFYLWIILIIYKTSFQEFGHNVIFSNIPTNLIPYLYPPLNFFNILTNIGLLPLILGFVTMFSYLFIQKSKAILFFIGQLTSVFLLLLFKLIRIELGLIFISLIFVILFGKFLQDSLVYTKKTKFEKHINLYLIIISIILCLIQVVPGYFVMRNNTNEGFSSEYIKGFMFLNNLSSDSIILGLPKEGHLITYFGHKKNIIDTHYISIKDSDQRYTDVIQFYSENFKIPALRILEKYNASHFIVSKSISEYNISKISFIPDECFKLIFNESIQIYEIRKDICKIQNEK